MKRKIAWVVPVLLAGALMAGGCAGLGAAAVVGGIVYYKSSHHETATVNVNAKPDKVYQVALETIEAAGTVEITKQDEAKGLIEMKHEKQALSLKVTALNAALTQLTITSDVEKGAPGSKDAVLKRIGEICDKLGVEHHVIK